jgi:hypothetical protein
MTLFVNTEKSKPWFPGRPLNATRGVESAQQWHGDIHQDDFRPEPAGRLNGFEAANRAPRDPASTAFSYHVSPTMTGTACIDTPS